LWPALKYWRDKILITKKYYNCELTKDAGSAIKRMLALPDEFPLATNFFVVKNLRGLRTTVR